MVGAAPDWPKAAQTGARLWRREDGMKDGPEDACTLVVDLDGTLLSSDLLHETFWAGLGANWRLPFTAAAALLRGRAGLKRHLAEAAPLDVETLPFDDEVLAFVRAWRARGGRTVLATASDQTLAEAVAAHLGLFDEVHGSDGRRNLKGREKARFLEARYGRGNYHYVGDSRADLPVWAGAGGAVTANASSGVRALAEKFHPDATHLGGRRRDPGAYLRALRPHQWLKNILVFLPALAAHRVDAATLWLSALAFVAFSLVASSVYVLNDLLDLAADRAHPRKRARPFASGRVPISHGAIMAPGLALAGGLIAMTIGRDFALTLGAYYLLTLAYSLQLKRRIVIDICVLAGLYTARILAGGTATGIPLSVWLLAFSVFIFLSLAAVKRQAELVDSARRGKLGASGRGYTVEDLPIIPMIAIGAGYAAVLVLMLYVNSPEVQALYARPEALWGVCAVLLYWITRMVMVAHRGHMHDDPIVHALRDRISLLCLAAIAGLAAWGAMG